MAWLEANVMENSGYLVGSAIFLALLVVLVIAQIVARKIPSLPVLGDYRSLNDIRHYVGRLCRSLARHWICRRVAAAVHLPHGRARHLVLVGGHDLGEQRKHATSRGLLLGGDHLFTDTRNRARRLDRRHRQTRV